MSRGWLAGFVIAGWLCAMGWNARREFFRPPAERLALGAATLPPGTAYFTIDAGDRPAGMASVQVDTLPARTGFYVLEQYSFRIPGLGTAGRTDIRVETWLGPGVALDSLAHRTARGDDTTIVRFVVDGDSIVRVGAGGRTATPVSEAANVQTDASWPLRFAAAGGSEPGETRRLTVLDPVSGSLSEVHLRTVEQATRVFADSADTHPETGAWLAAGTDTVTAWRIERTRAAAGSTTAWVDEDGRYVEMELPGGYRLSRTAFELAFNREDR